MELPISKPPSSKPIDKFIPWFFVIFFVLLALLLADFVMLANKTNPGVVTDDAYQKGLAYNQVIEAQKRQDQLGWQADLNIQKTAKEPATIIFKLMNKEKKPLEKATVRATFVRPSQQNHDVTIDLMPAQSGFYEGKAILPLSGLWDVHITVLHEKDSYQMTKRVTLP